MWATPRRCLFLIWGEKKQRSRLGLILINFWEFHLPRSLLDCVYSICNWKNSIPAGIFGMIFVSFGGSFHLGRRTCSFFMVCLWFSLGLDWVLFWARDHEILIRNCCLVVVGWLLEWLERVGLNSSSGFLMAPTSVLTSMILLHRLHLSRNPYLLGGPKVRAFWYLIYLSSWFLSVCVLRSNLCSDSSPVDPSMHMDFVLTVLNSCFLALNGELSQSYVYWTLMSCFWVFCYIFYDFSH